MKNRLRGLIKQIVKAISNPTGEETLAEGIADNQAYMELVTGHLAGRS